MTDLSTLHGCLSELEDCSNGLARLDHLISQAIDLEVVQTATWESYEADALRSAREDAPKGATATEIKGLVTDWVNRRPSATTSRIQLRETQASLAKLERFARSLEKRMSAAQSASNIHSAMGRYGGG